MVQLNQQRVIQVKIIQKLRLETNFKNLIQMSNQHPLMNKVLLNLLLKVAQIKPRPILMKKMKLPKTPTPQLTKTNWNPSLPLQIPPKKIPSLRQQAQQAQIQIQSRILQHRTMNKQLSTMLKTTI